MMTGSSNSSCSNNSCSSNITFVKKHNNVSLPLSLSLSSQMMSKKRGGCKIKRNIFLSIIMIVILFCVVSNVHKMTRLNNNGEKQKHNSSSSSSSSSSNAHSNNNNSPLRQSLSEFSSSTTTTTTTSSRRKKSNLKLKSKTT